MQRLNKRRSIPVALALGAALLVRLAAANAQPAQPQRSRPVLFVPLKITGQLRVPERRLRRTLAASMLSTGRFTESVTAETAGAVQECVRQVNTDANADTCWVRIGQGQGAELMVSGGVEGSAQSCDVDLRLTELETRVSPRVHYTVLEPCSGKALRAEMQRAAAVLAGVARVAQSPPIPASVAAAPATAPAPATPVVAAAPAPTEVATPPPVAPQATRPPAAAPAPPAPSEQHAVPGSGPPTPEPTSALALEARRDYRAALQRAREVEAVAVPSGSPRALKRALLKKAKLLQTAEAALKKILERKQPYWSVAALSSAGDLYYRFAKWLLEVPAPRELTPEQEDIYRMALEEQATPMEDKAVAYWAAALKLARAQRIDSAHARQAARMLAQARP